MVNTGERPTENGEQEATEQVDAVGLGQQVYDESGAALGTVRGLDASGFFVTTREGAEALSVEHARAGQAFGEAELMWRCTECGEMGELDRGFPDRCPNCDTARENLMYWTED
ncbi:hypothetical protein [Halovivax sp.]|uniref:DUF7130 family rubredoxin-like protein n=1 Tax=Halovivax sp. TaxID=1935978 RepID=UPI0025BA6497|nr:hypothetical protein [Halovivax sp.]